ncbi:MAG: YraN family protein [Acidobacteriota bacterium]
MSYDRFAAQPHRRARGGVGEAFARQWLEAQGVRIVAANVHTRVGEIDLVALEGETLCFVEVKARSDSSFGPAVAAVDAPKQRRLARCAALYLQRHPHDGPCRFDVLGLDADPRAAGGWRVSWVQDAFQVA